MHKKSFQWTTWSEWTQWTTLHNNAGKSINSTNSIKCRFLTKTKFQAGNHYKLLSQTIDEAKNRLILRNLQMLNNLQLKILLRNAGDANGITR